MNSEDDMKEWLRLEAIDAAVKAGPTPEQRAAIRHAFCVEKFSWLKSELDRMGSPEKFTTDQLQPGLNREQLSNLQRACNTFGYSRVLNPATKDGRWKVGGKNVVMYAKLPAQPRTSENPNDHE